MGAPIFVLTKLPLHEPPDGVLEGPERFALAPEAILTAEEDTPLDCSPERALLVNGVAVEGELDDFLPLWAMAKAGRMGGGLLVFPAEAARGLPALDDAPDRSLYRVG